VRVHEIALLQTIRSVVLAKKRRSGGGHRHDQGRSGGGVMPKVVKNGLILGGGGGIVRRVGASLTGSLPWERKKLNKGNSSINEREQRHARKELYSKKVSTGRIVTGLEKLDFPTKVLFRRGRVHEKRGTLPSETRKREVH